MKTLVLVDTSIWIGFFSKTGYPHLKEHLSKLLDDNTVATAGPVALELLQGCRSTKERRTLQEQLEGVHWLETKDHHWFQAGKLSNDLRQKGITVSAIDALIAILAQTYNCQLMHLDQDYQHIAKHTTLSLLKIEAP